MLKNKKRTLLVAVAIVFLVVLVLIKTKIIFNNENNPANQAVVTSGLTYDNEILGDLVNRDTDGDGVLDWEESLWGTDPKKKDTNDDGVADSIEIEKLKKQNGQSGQTQNENLTQTDQFSRELFATVTALNQTGAMDQATVDKLSDALANQIQNSTSKKVFLVPDLKIIKDENREVFEDYAITLGNIFRKHTLTVSIPDILAESMTSDGEIDIKVLNKLDPVVKQVKAIVDEMVGIDVPASLALLHLNALNGFEKLAESLNDIKLVDTDVILAIRAISQYQQNDDLLKSSLEKLKAAVDKKLNN